MGRQSYLMRREGRYYFNSRFAPFGDQGDPKTHIRFALRTASKKVAVRRIALVLPVITHFRSCHDYRTFARDALISLDAALRVPSPTADHLVFWSGYEAMVQKFLTASHAVEYPLVKEFEDFWPTWKTFLDRVMRLEERVRDAGEDGELGGAPVPYFYPVLGEDSDPSACPPIPITHLRRRPVLEPAEEIGSFENPWPEEDQRDGTLYGEAVKPRHGFVDRTESEIRPTTARHPDPCRAEHGDVSATPRRPLDGAADRASSPALSDVVAEFLHAERISAGDDRARESAGRVFEFAIALIGDKPLTSIDRSDWSRLEHAIVAIPHPSGLKGAKGVSIYERYVLGQKDPKAVTRYLSDTTIRGTYHLALHALFAFAVKKGFLGSAPYQFDLVGIANPSAEERDAFRPDEIRKLFSLPLFQGAKSPTNYWLSGTLLIQNEIYWAIILIFFMGLRHSEIGKLLVSDLVFEGERWFVDLRELKQEDQSAGDKRLRRKLKTKSSQRKLPVPQFIVDLGLIERRDALAKAGEETLFLEWKVYTNSKSGRPMVGQHLSKSWQYIKKRFGFDREFLTLYSGRHTRAGWFDALDLPARIRNRLLGHSSERVSDGYGPIDLSDEELQLLDSRSLPIEVEIAELLLGAKERADRGELERVVLPGRRERRRPRIEALKRPPAKRGRPPKASKGAEP